MWDHFCSRQPISYFHISLTSSCRIVQLSIVTLWWDIVALSLFVATDLEVATYSHSVCTWCCNAPHWQHPRMVDPPLPTKPPWSKTGSTRQRIPRYDPPILISTQKFILEQKVRCLVVTFVGLVKPIVSVQALSTAWYLVPIFSSLQGPSYGM